MWFLFTHKKNSLWINFFLIFILSFGLIDSVSGKLIMKFCINFILNNINVNASVAPVAKLKKSNSKKCSTEASVF